MLDAASDDVVASHLLALRSHSSGGAALVISRTTARPSRAAAATRAVSSQPISPSSTLSTAMKTAPRKVSGRTEARRESHQLLRPDRLGRQRRLPSCSRIRSSRSRAEPGPGCATTAAVACSMAASSRERGKTNGLYCEVPRVSQGRSVRARTMESAASYGVSPPPSRSFTGTRRNWFARWT